MPATDRTLGVQEAMAPRDRRTKADLDKTIADQDERLNRQVELLRKLRDAIFHHRIANKQVLAGLSIGITQGVIEDILNGANERSSEL